MVDENLPPRLAEALACLFRDKHEVVHLRARFGPKVADADWMNVLNHEGSWVVISGDRRITRYKTEQRIFRSSRIIGFFLSPGLKKARLTKQMERLMALWEIIEKQVELVDGGAMFEVPMKSLKLKQI